MNWEAFLVVCMVSVVLGALLFSVAMLYLKISDGRPSPGVQSIGLNKLGWVLILIFLLMMFLGFSVSHLAPNSFLARILGDSINRFLYLVIIVAVFFLVERVLLYFGITLRKKGGRST